MPEWIEFRLEARRPGRKTDVWSVVAKQSQAVIGVVKWYPGWRTYCFFPNPGSVYDAQCLSDIAAFIGERRRLHRARMREGV